MGKQVALVLSGCGHKDGSEITEAVSCLIALTEAGAHVSVFAPTLEFPVADPLTGKPTGEKRDVLVESARIARGDVRDLALLVAADFDALVFPGGFGAAKNLSNWATSGAAAQVHPQVERVIKEFYAAEKPIGAVCIAPTLLARVLGPHQITLTIGVDEATAAQVEKCGAHHEECAVKDYVSDREHRIVTTPAYMYDNAEPCEVFAGIQGAMRELVEMA